MSQRRWRVLIADDEVSVRRLVRTLVGQDGRFEVVAEATDAVEAVEAARTHEPDVAILDVEMPGGGAADGARLIAAFSPRTRIVVYTGHDDDEVVLAMLEAGVDAYVSKGSDPEELLVAIETAVAGGVHLSSGINTAMVRQLARLLERTGQQRLRRDRVRARIDRMIAGGAFHLAFQPIRSLVGDGLVGVEALCRFDVEPLTPPDRWFRDAADVGRCEHLELVVVARALEVLDDVPADAYLALNVTPQTACSPELAQMLARSEPARIVLEITEHHPIDDYAAVIDALAELRRRGLRVAIDDVGAGFANMRHVLHLEPDIVKLDGALTTGVHSDGARLAIATGMVAMAAAAGITVVAEGVETAAEAVAMRHIGVTACQGFGTGRPGTLPEALEMRIIDLDGATDPATSDADADGGTDQVRGS